MRILRLLSIVSLVLSLVAVLGLLVLDGLHGFRMTEGHQKAGALALILIGASYVSVYLGGRMSRGIRARAIFLGAAFSLWGTEQFMPAGVWSTLVDGAVIVIFVIDLSFSVVQRLKNQDGPDKDI